MVGDSQRGTDCVRVCVVRSAFGSREDSDESLPPQAVKIKAPVKVPASARPALRKFLCIDSPLLVRTVAENDFDFFIGL
jgi:hypothetical protein